MIAVIIALGGVATVDGMEISLEYGGDIAGVRVVMSQRMVSEMCKKMVVLLTLFLLLSLLPACNLPGATIEVGCSVPDLIAAINQANNDSTPNTINLAAGCTYTLTEVNNTATFTPFGATYDYGDNGLPQVVTPIIINGNGAVIRRAENAPPFRFFYVDSSEPHGTAGSLTLNDLTLLNGFVDTHRGDIESMEPGSGGAIFVWKGDLEINGSTLQSNRAIARGGAIKAVAAQVVINDSVLKENTAETGGGIYATGTLSITGSQFIANSARSGGGIGMTWGGELNVRDSTFSENQVEARGGGIVKMGGAYQLDTMIRNTTFQGNVAGWGGGGIYISHAPLSVSGSTFVANQAEEGGGLFFQDHEGAEAHVTGSTFANNRASLNGGAIHFAGAMMYLTESRFLANHAGDGAAVVNASSVRPYEYHRPDTTMIVASCTFSENVATADGSGVTHGYGGGIYNRGDLTVRGTDLGANYAQNGGGIYNRSGYLVVESSHFSGNKVDGAGGGIYSQESGTQIEDAIFDHNYAVGGAGVWDTDGTLGVQDSRFESNQSGGNGGGTALQNSVSTVENTGFEANTAASGGAAEVMSGGLTATGCEFLGNKVSGEGGAVYNLGGTVLIREGLLQDNGADGRGGGVANYHQLSLFSSEVRANTAGAEGGGVFSDGSADLMKCVVLENHTDLSGGGVYNGYSGTFTLRNNTLRSNVADDDGGGIASRGLLDARWNTLVDNHARRGGGLAVLMGVTTLVNDTLSANVASEAGGGVFSKEEGEAGSRLDVLISHVTLAYNQAGLGGGLAAFETMQVKNSIVAYSASGGDCEGSLVALGENLSTDGSCTGFSTMADPLLLPLANNGGLTYTHALDSGSPAIDAVSDCTTVSGASVTEDQRSVPRPMGASCDLGSYEWRPLLSTPLPASLAITAREDIACRAGPGNVYSEVDYLTQGQQAVVTGRNQESTWLQVEGPNWRKLCWVWAELVDSGGQDIDQVPIATAPPPPTLTPTSVPSPPACSSYTDQHSCESNGCVWLKNDTCHEP